MKHAVSMKTGKVCANTEMQKPSKKRKNIRKPDGASLASFLAALIAKYPPPSKPDVSKDTTRRMIQLTDTSLLLYMMNMDSLDLFGGRLN